MKIRTRLILYFTLLVTFLLIIHAVTTYYSINQIHEKEFYNRLHAKALTATFLLLKVKKIDAPLLKIIDKYQYDLLNNENISICDSTNHEIYTNNDTINFISPPGLFDKIRAEKEIRYRQGPFKIIAFYYTDKVNKVVVFAGAIDTGGEAIQKDLAREMLISMIGFIIIIPLLGWFFVSRALQPISSIIEKVNTISPLEHSERLPVLTQKDEIADLITTFNQLFDKLEDSFSHQKNFVANISHELNNPLAKIKAQIEVSLMQGRNPESYRQTLQSILEDLDELIKLIQNLMQFSKLSYGPFTTQTSIRIDELLFDIRDVIIEEHPDFNITINFPSAPADNEHYIISANKQLLSTALKNIFENACKFSPDKLALVTLSFEKNTLLLSVKDNGPGISAEELPHIFEMFYRSPHPSAVKGFGVGLSLTGRILKAHHFPFQVDSEVGKGTTFLIWFAPR